jgi:ribonucleotide monophosphatase NagD (HAD superfamily)
MTLPQLDLSLFLFLLLSGWLQAHNVPYVFMTNGGGCTEETKAASLSALLDEEVSSFHYASPR